MRKPSIPSGVAPWLREILEVVIGRRQNKIDVPPARALTFSATPTKAECEALYAYVHDVRAALDALVSRLDS